jgi:protein-disulfide isomerase
MASELDFEIPQRPSPTSPRRWLRRIFLAIAFLVLAGMVAVTVYAWQQAQRMLQETTPNTLTNASVLAAVGDAGQIPGLVRADAPARGPRTSKVVIVEFSDFECPYCGEMFPVMDELERRYGERVRFVYRNFPLFDIHPNAVPAALAAMCAHEQGKFWEMHDLLFANQTTLSEEMYKRYALDIGLDSIQFGTCYQSQKYLSVVQRDLQDGIAAGVSATPTIFVNNVKIDGTVDIGTIEQLIIRGLSQ